VCQAPRSPGASAGAAEARSRRAGDEGCAHSDLVRSVVMGEDFVLSGSYDLSIKVRVLA
jgi:hypothetical protein